MSNVGFVGPPAPARKSPRWPYAVLLVAVVLLGGGVWKAYDRGLIIKDSGLEACTAMRGGSKTLTGSSADGKPMTEAEYRRIREIFAKSRYDDIRENGTRLLDIGWHMSQAEDEGGGALLYAQPLATHMLGLESACADRGIFLPVKTTTTKVAETRPTSCAQVFRNGQNIARNFDGTCSGAQGVAQFVTAFACKDGRKLYLVAATTGATGGWGYGGSKYQGVGEPTKDPAYSAAVQRCLA